MLLRFRLPFSHIFVFAFIINLFSQHSWGSESSESNDTPWKHESELGIVVNGGNSQAETLNTKTQSTYALGGDQIRLWGQYIFSATSRIMKVRNWRVASAFDWYFSERTATFFSPGSEGDTFAGYQYRLNMDVGSKHFLIKNKEDSVMAELGYRYRFEKAVDAAIYLYARSHFIRLYIEQLHYWRDGLFTKTWVELMPDLADSQNLNLNFEVSLTSAFNEHFALKLAYGGRYDHQPAVIGDERFDYIYTTSFVANY